MPKTSSFNLTSRDLDILAAIDRCPLTTQQLMTASQTFAQPFTDSHHVRRRLRQLKQAGFVQSWQTAVAATGRSPDYYKLTRDGYRLLYGDDAVIPKRRHFESIAPAQHYHMLALADFIVRLVTLCFGHQIRVQHFARENQFRVEAGSFVTYPDCTFQLVMPDGRTLNYFVELDRGTERVRSKQDVESIERKLRAYDLHNARFDARDPARPLVLFVTTRSAARIDNILNAAQAVMKNPKRTVFVACELATFQLSDAIAQPVLRDNRNLFRQLVPNSSPAVPHSSPLTTKLAEPFPTPASTGVL